LQMATADVAYTNSKKTSDLEGMVASLIYRTLERNTNGVGIKSALCTTVRAANPEIAALEQHQDPASFGAADHNRAVILELARQISLIGGNPVKAFDASTFTPGWVGDSSGKGNSCNAPNCIYEGGRLHFLVSKDEITAYVSKCVATLTVSTTITQPRPMQVATQTVPLSPSDVAPISASIRITAPLTSAASATRVPPSSNRDSVPDARTPAPDSTNDPPPVPPPSVPH